ncbi:Type II secretion system protein L [Pseudoalteromonas sp. THAF3]|uniref:type II secretion system protein GspL n=1 Tax=Pseudoalteromonas sp. THAF3 TaxID=2587843 RepID=UPI0012A86B81|nr:type II secretion system protein GspL [Pseudoalteromonas sp. THAF3]QFU06087.1 Type II secretion system protein L [Pseudoalteromonas sp. THAF3]
MRESLLIHVGERPDQPIHWLVYNRSENEIIGSGQLHDANELEQLATKAHNRECTLVLPSAQVQCHRVQLPTKWSRKLEQALPYMIEEQVAVDVDSLFIAHGQAHSDGEQHFIQVALVNRQWLQNWLSVLSNAQLLVEHIHSDALLLPEPQPQRATAMAVNEHSFLVRYGAWHGAQLEPQWAEAFLSAVGVQTLDLYSPLPGYHSEQIATEVHEEKFELPLAMFATASSPIDLRQGEFAYKKQSYGWLKTWRPAMVAAAVTLVFMLGVKGAQLYHYSSQAEATKAQVISTYERAFPGTKVRPHLLRSQINGALKESGQGPSAQFLLLLQDFADVVQQSKQFVPQTLRFDQRRNELRVGARGQDFQSFGQVKAKLEQRGLDVEQGSLNNDGESVIGELRIRGAQ